MFGFVKNHWYRWRVNKWLVLRRNGVPQETALKKSLLSADRIACFLHECLEESMSSVGFLTISSGKVTGGTTFGQTALILRGLADLCSVLPAEEVTKIKTLLNELERHNWGGVRRGATEAKKWLPKEVVAA